MFATDNTLARRALEVLSIDQRFKIKLLVLPKHKEIATPGLLIDLRAPHSLEYRASRLGIPTVEYGKERLEASLVAAKPDIALVVCFPSLIGPELLAVPRLGFVNVHTSLLPENRGPDPIFWSLRNGSQLGVTLHVMDQGFDTGDILAQRPISVRAGSSRAQIDQVMAEELASFIPETLGEFANSSIAPSVQKGGSYQSWPAASAFEISTEWTSSRAFSFVRGSQDYGARYAVRTAAGTLLVREALSHVPGRALKTEFVREGGLVTISFSDGVITFREVRPDD